MDDDEPITDWHAPELEAARTDIQRAITRYSDELSRQRGEDPLFVTEWVVMFEGTNVDLEQNDKRQRDTIVPVSQSLSAAIGLAAWAAARWV